MKRVLAGLVVAGAAAMIAPPASAHPICVDHPRTPYEWFCVPNPL